MRGPGGVLARRADHRSDPDTGRPGIAAHPRPAAMSATLAARPTVHGPAGGGVAARRAVTRWAWRLLRREWRQQALGVALLALTGAAAALSVAAAHNAASPPRPHFGSAQHPLPLARARPQGPPAHHAAAPEGG